MTTTKTVAQEMAEIALEQDRKAAEAVKAAGLGATATLAQVEAALSAAGIEHGAKRYHRILTATPKRRKLTGYQEPSEDIDMRTGSRKYHG